MKLTACPALVVNIGCASSKLTRSDSTYKPGNSVQTSGATERDGFMVRSQAGTLNLNLRDTVAAQLVDNRCRGSSCV